MQLSNIQGDQLIKEITNMLMFWKMHCLRMDTPSMVVPFKPFTAAHSHPSSYEKMKQCTGWIGNK